MAFKDLTIFGKPAFDTPQTDTQAHANGALSILGRTLQGIAAPFGAAYGNDFGIKQMQLQAQQDQADMEFQRYLNQQKASSDGKPIFTIGENGQLVAIGSVPKGSQVISPTGMQTPEQKDASAVDTTVKKDLLGRASKLQELLPVLDTYGQMLQSVPTGTGVKGKIKGQVSAIAGAIQQDPVASGIQSNIDATLPQIARGMSEVGNLSEYEQQRAKGFIPLVNDAEDTRAMKSLGGYLFIKNKLTQAGKRAGMLDDPSFSQPLSQLEDRINNTYKTALGLGIDAKKLDKFLGSNGLEYKPTFAPGDISAEQKAQYNKLRASGMSAVDARKKVGF